MFVRSGVVYSSQDAEAADVGRVRRQGAGMSETGPLHVCAMERYSTSTRKDILTRAPARANLEDIALCEIRQSQKDKYCTSPLIGGAQSRQVRGDKTWEWGGQRLMGTTRVPWTRMGGGDDVCTRMRCR